MGSNGHRTLGLGDRAKVGALLGVEHLLLRSSKLPTTPFLDSTLFAWSGSLEARWRSIRAELDGLLPYYSGLPNFQDLSPEQLSLTQDEGWKTFFFYACGIASEANCGRCPQTAAALREIPGMTSAFFSILGPHKHLPPHRGPYRGVLRCHLALKVPAPNNLCGISVGGETRQWAEGETMFFDDGYEHWAWNDSEQVRVVLFIDFIRPLPSYTAWLNRFMLARIARSAPMRSGEERHRAWEQQFETLLNASRQAQQNGEVTEG